MKVKVSNVLPPPFGWSVTQSTHGSPDQKWSLCKPFNGFTGFDIEIVPHGLTPVEEALSRLPPETLGRSPVTVMVGNVVRRMTFHQTANE